jgi:alkylhydroperoxidase family enzyme
MRRQCETDLRTPMARVPYLDQSDLPPEHKDILARPIALNRAMANSPNASRAMGVLASYIRHKSKLDTRLREMAILQVGYLAKSPYEWSHHVKLGREFGVSDDDIRAIGEETAGRATKLDELSKTVLRGAREMTNDLAMSDATYAALENALGREQVIDLTLAIAFYNAVVRLLGTLQIDVEPEYQRYLEEHPLPR